MIKGKYFETEREIEITEEVDVLVVGGGPAGVGAAIGAARSGASVMIIEAMGSFGGMWTNGLVITLGGYNNWLRPYQRCVDGVMGEWLRLAEQRGGACNNRSWVLHSDPEIMKTVSDEMLLDANVKCLLHTWVADAIVEDNKVKGVITENVEGRKAVMANVVIDCTGNGDLIARAGESFTVSDRLQPMTNNFFFAEVDQDGEIPYDEEVMIPFGPEPGLMDWNVLGDYQSPRRDIYIDREKLKEAHLRGEFPEYGGPWFGGMRKRFPWVNTTRVYANGINIAQLTKAEMDARKSAHQMIDYYRKNVKGFENSWILRTAATIGIRETRQLDGVYRLTGKDLVNGQKFDDSIAVGAWPIDIHPQKGESGQHKLYVPLPFQIPYRTMLPRKIDNLLVAGRCIAADREAMGSIRVGATCGAIGQAAGIAAAISAKSDVTPRTIPVKVLQQEIVRQKGIIEI